MERGEGEGVDVIWLFNKCVTCWSLLKVWFIPWGGNCASVTRAGSPDTRDMDVTLADLLVAVVTAQFSLLLLLLHMYMYRYMLQLYHTHIRTLVQKKITTDFLVITMH